MPGQRQSGAVARMEIGHWSDCHIPSGSGFSPLTFQASNTLLSPFCPHIGGLITHAILIIMYQYDRNTLKNNPDMVAKL